MGLVRFLAIAAVAALALGAAGSTDADAAKKPGKCVLAGGQGTGIGDVLAKSMADDALKEALSKGGMKGSGKVSYKCDNNPIIATCTASQRACK